MTALDDELSQVRALDGGGDDYVTKPFALKVLVSRVNALLRRGARSGGEGRDELANLRMDAGRSYADGRDVGLTATEWEAIRALRQNAGCLRYHCLENWTRAARHRRQHAFGACTAPCGAYECGRAETASPPCVSGIGWKPDRIT